MSRILYSLADSELLSVGEKMHELMRDLFPLCRSITGDGARKTHSKIGEIVPLQTHEVPTGTEIFDWTVPPEWNIRDAYVRAPSGEKIIDFKTSNIHVLNYSTPISARMGLAKLKEHLHTLPDQPDVIPYLTSYYSEDWGFCLTDDQLRGLADDEYEVVIDSSLGPGSLTYSEYYLRGRTADEILISCYTCHPSLCNDNLSGVVLATYLAKYLSGLSLNYSYRFLFIPETIGAVAWLFFNQDKVGNIKHGLVATCVGDPGESTYQRTRQGDTELDDAAVNVLQNSGSDYAVRDFIPYGSDERQFSSPGFDLPMGLLMRTPYGEFPQYHTSADDLNFVQPGPLADSFSKYLSILHILEHNRRFVNLAPMGEPQLSKRGLHRKIGGQKWDEASSLAMYWVLNFSDGRHTLLNISNRSRLRFDIVKAAADSLQEHGLLEELL